MSSRHPSKRGCIPGLATGPPVCHVLDVLDIPRCPFGRRVALWVATWFYGGRCIALSNRAIQLAKSSTFFTRWPLLLTSGNFEKERINSFIPHLCFDKRFFHICFPVFSLETLCQHIDKGLSLHWCDGAGICGVTSDSRGPDSCC